MRFGTHRQFGTRAKRKISSEAADRQLSAGKARRHTLPGMRLIKRTRSLFRGKAAEVLRTLGAALSLSIWFVPGLFFVLIGLCAVFAPELVVGTVAAFFVFLGFSCCLLAWRFLEFKRRLETLARSFEARIMVQGVPVGKIAEPEERSNESTAGASKSDVLKKILYH